MSNRPLAALERCHLAYGPGLAQARLVLLRQLDRTRLSTAGQVRRLHEALCFLRAYPDDGQVLRQVERMLARFERRADLRMHRDELAYSGIAGTTIWFPFFYPTARWVAARWPDALRLDRTDAVAEESLAKLLPALMSPLEAHALRESHMRGFRALDRLRGTRTDATFLIERVTAMPGNEITREAFYDLINPSCELLATRYSPSRTRAWFSGGPQGFRTRPIGKTGSTGSTRPDLRKEIRRAPRGIARLGGAQAQGLVDLARESMVTRERDLDAFAHGNPRDTWLIDDGEGLAFALIGMVPARRVALPAIYGGLTLQNGVPIGYHQSDVIGRGVAVSFNAFDTFRGGESAHVFARYLAALHAMFGATGFSIEPYQLGRGNDEGIGSGAWWFYRKQGFRPRARTALRLAASENARMQRDPVYRSSEEMLKRLAEHYLFFELEPSRPNPLILPAAIGLKVGAFLARLSDDRDRAQALAGERAQRACAASRLDLSGAERRAWDSLAPLLAMLRCDRWPPTERRALLRLVRAKAAPSEMAYVRALREQPRLLQRLAGWSRGWSQNVLPHGDRGGLIR
jgi:hypothetical protein